MRQNSIQQKIDSLQKKFDSLISAEKKYLEIIEMGKKLPPPPKTLKNDLNKVHGCQSNLYIEATYNSNKLFFSVDADALISKGLAALLLSLFDGEGPQEILTTPPLFLKNLQIPNLLSVNRTQGLLSLYKKIISIAAQYANNN